MSEPRPERGGKARRCVRAVPAAERALLDSRRALDSMWQDLELASREGAR
jgi:hypothetical protein